MKEIEGKLSAKGLKVALVASRFNSFLVEQLVKGAADAFNRLGGDAAGLVLVRVPGASEIPVTAKKLAASKKFDAVVGLGAVVQGASCLTLSDPMDCSSPGSSVHVIPQARILGWVAISSSGGSS